MFFLRKFTPFLLMLLMGICALAACGTNETHLLSPNDIARQVGTHYAETHPQITYMKSDQTDNPPHDPMYVMTLAGHFHKGTFVASSLSFSALASKMYVWNIYAHNQAGQEVWHDMELGSR